MGSPTGNRMPFLALVPKNESPDGFAGKYIELVYFKPSLIDLDLRKRKTRRNPNGTVND